MKAVAYQKSLPISAPDSLLDVDLPIPEATGRDLLVRVEAISVNPVDTKIRKRQEPAEGDYAVLGWDASGVIEAVGPDVTLFQTEDLIKQHQLLAKAANLIDAGKLKTTLAETFGPINATNLRRAHELIESNTSRGKIVLTGFS